MTPLREIIGVYAIKAHELGRPVMLEDVNGFLASWGRATLTAAELRALLPSHATILAALHMTR